MQRSIWCNSAWAGLILATRLVTGCSSDNPLGFNDSLQTLTEAAYTYQRPDGNRFVSGQGALPNTEPLDIPLSGSPQWVVAAPVDEGSVWAVVLSNGRVQAFDIFEGEVTPVTITPDRLPPGTPPLLAINDNGEAKLANVLDIGASLLTHPTFLDKREGRLAYIESSGSLVIQSELVTTRLPVNALPDARILTDENERLLLLTDPTGRYAHGVLGDAVGAASITLVETRPIPRVALKITIPDPAVVEGVAPIWADLTGDGVREIIVTLSDAKQGAQIAAFSETGQQIATGPAIGRGFRWRHQLAVAPFGIGSDLELVSVRTPHIGGTVEFFQSALNTLNIAAQESGYTSHVLASRNLDMAVAGDFDGEGQIELLLPNQALTELGAIRRTTNGAQLAWSVRVGGRVRTNLAAVTLTDNRIAVGVGDDRQMLRIWLP